MADTLKCLIHGHFLKILSHFITLLMEMMLTFMLHVRLVDAWESFQN